MSCVQGVRSRVVAAAPAARAEEAAAPAAFRAPKAKAAFAGLAPSLARGARVVSHAVAERESRAADPRYAAFAAALDKYDFNFRVGDKVTGTVIMVENNGIYVDIGAKGAAFCPAAECAMGKASKARARRASQPRQPAGAGAAAARGATP
jgi:small subunit ribosomal protein S1